jgi:hypothetical protein
VRAAAEPGLRSVPEHALRFREIKKTIWAAITPMGRFVLVHQIFQTPFAGLDL